MSIFSVTQILSQISLFLSFSVRKIPMFVFSLLILFEFSNDYPEFLLYFCLFSHHAVRRGYHPASRLPIHRIHFVHIFLKHRATDINGYARVLYCCSLADSAMVYGFLFAAETEDDADRATAKSMRNEKHMYRCVFPKLFHTHSIHPVSDLGRSFSF